jgi:uncharacterized protein
MLPLAALLCGILFGLGLVISRMVNPAKVINFLDVAGDWDPTLALVFIGALLVAVPGLQWILRTRRKPVIAPEFKLPDNNAITPSLVSGAALFGVGWGLAGFCPGPGLTALATLQPGVIAWVAAMFAGIVCYQLVTNLRSNPEPPEE